MGLTALDHRAIFDVFCQGKNGKQFIVEMQRTRQAFFKDRSIFYATFPIQEQSTKGDWDYRLPPVYTVSVLDFVIDQQQQNPSFIHRVELKDDNGKRFYDKLSFIYIELPKFTKTLSQLNTHEDKWFYIFRYLPELANQPQPINEPIFDELFEVAEIAKFSREEQDAYQATLKAYRDFNNIMDTAVQEAKEDARTEEARSLILRQLRRQVGELPDSIRVRLQEFSLNQFEALADDLLDFNHIDDFRQWLNDHLLP